MNSIHYIFLSPPFRIQIFIICPPVPLLLDSCGHRGAILCFLGLRAPVIELGALKSTRWRHDGHLLLKKSNPKLKNQLQCGEGNQYQMQTGGGVQKSSNVADFI